MRNTTILSWTIALLAPATAAAQVEGEGEVGVGVEGEASATTDATATETTTTDTTTADTAMTAPAAGGISGAGDLGVGGDSTLTGVGGLHVRYQMSEQLALQGLLGARIATADGYADTFAIGVQAFYRMNSADNGAMGLFGGVDFADFTIGEDAMAIDATQFGLAAGLYGEWFPDPAFSVHAQAGVRFAYTSGDIAGTDVSGNNLAIGGDSVAQLGFTYWFR